MPLCQSNSHAVVKVNKGAVLFLTHRIEPSYKLASWWFSQSSIRKREASLTSSGRICRRHKAERFCHISLSLSSRPRCFSGYFYWILGYCSWNRDYRLYDSNARTQKKLFNFVIKLVHISNYLKNNFSCINTVVKTFLCRGTLRLL